MEIIAISNYARLDNKFTGDGRERFLQSISDSMPERFPSCHALWFDSRQIKN
jgi:hypothetical protein